ncbi:MAG: hypothetical protein ABIH83_05350 [Candidatus Micrarchaeota archaeon]
MADFLGITKRKWLAFGILALLLATMQIIASLWAGVLGEPATDELAFISVFTFVLIFVALVVANVVINQLAGALDWKVNGRYIAAALVAFGNFAYSLMIGAPVLIALIMSVVYGVMCLVLYIISCWVSDLIIPQAFSKHIVRVKKKIKG